MRGEEEEKGGQVQKRELRKQWAVGEAGRWGIGLEQFQGPSFVQKTVSKSFLLTSGREEILFESSKTVIKIFVLTC